MTKEQNQLYELINDLLWYEWDPIGINDLAPKDEYQTYVPQIFSLALKNSTAGQIAQNLDPLKRK